jgi:DNA-binding SARP family transcriptional activator/class 3 adenylate cyclase
MPSARKPARTSAPSAIRVYTLGRFALEVDGQPLRFAGKAPRKPLELLKAVIALGGADASLEQLCESLWPELDGDKAHNACKSALSRLRKLVGSDAVLQQGGRLSLDGERCWVDALAFAERLGAALRAVEARRTDAALAELDAALPLYGGPFLDGEFDPPEVLAARERLHGLFTRHLGAVADALCEAGQPQQALRLYRQGLEMDDVCEEFCRGLMQCLATQGRAGEALEAGRRFRRVLQARMGVQPSAELEALVGRLEREAAQPHPAAPEPAGTAAGPPGAPSSAPPRAQAAAGATERGASHPAPAALPAAGGTLPAEGERRQVTALVFLLPGLSALGGDDPEAAEQAIRAVRETAQARVERHGGLVNQFLRDEMEAFFGVPAAQEDDARRAVRAALALCETVRLPGTSAGPAAGGSAGLDTGLVVVKPRGESGGRYAVTGAPLARAAQLAAQAGRQQVLVSTETHALVEPYFEAEPLARGKGRRPADAAAPLRVLRESAVRTAFQAAELRGLSAFVGREAELEALHGALRKALAGQGQFVSVQGEPGIGKSRLLHEFRLGVPRERATMIQGHCQSGGQHTPYLPLLDALRHGLQLRRSEAPQAQAEQAAAAVLAIDPALGPYLPVLLHVLSLPGERHPLRDSLKGTDLRAEVREVLGALLTASARRQPLALLLEDWQWADEASSDALRYLLGLVASAPLLVVVSERAEGATAWPALGNDTRLALQPLPGADSARLMRAALRSEDVPAGLEAQVHARTGGNPFFIEAVCGHLREGAGGAARAQPSDALSLPDTVQAVVRSRLDRLEPDAREALQLASLLGHQFSGRILERVHPSAAALAAGLERLKAHQLIRQVAVLPEPAYRFNHVITAEVAYETLLLARRKTLHGLVARAIEAQYAERLGEHIEALAHHFDRGELWEQAVDYRVRAGARAGRNGFVRIAMGHFDRAKEIMAGQRPELPWRVRFDLHFNRAEMLGELTYWDEAYEEILAASSLAAEHDDRALKIRTVFAKAVAGFWSHHFQEGYAGLNELERMVGDDPDQMLGLAAWQAMLMVNSENVAGALAKEREAHQWLERAPRSPHLFTALWNLAVFHRWRGEHAASAELFGRLRAAQEGRDSVLNIARTTVHYGMALVEGGHFEQAIQQMEEVLEITTRTGSHYATLRLENTLGWAYGELFCLEESIRHSEAALELVERVRGSAVVLLYEIESFVRLNLAEIYRMEGKDEPAQGLLETVYRDGQLPEAYLARVRWKPRCLLMLGELWLARGRLDNAERYLAEHDAFGATSGWPFRKLQVRALRLRAGLAAARGRREEAGQALEEAVRIAEAMGNPGELWKTRKAAAEYHRAQGQDKPAARHRRAAQAAVRQIEEGLKNPSLRERFMAAPPIRELFARSPRG